ncbi:MAG: DNA repair protein RecO [Gemmatimonadota bacterium]
MSLVRTEAFVLKAIRFGDTSVIYRLFTRDFGVVPVMARGVRRPKSRFGGIIEPFRRLQVTYYSRDNRDIQTLSGVELVTTYPAIVESLERLEAAGRWFRFLRGAAGPWRGRTRHRFRSSMVASCVRNAGVTIPGVDRCRQRSTHF